MLSCKQTSLLVSQSLDRKLSWREHLSVKLHLLICVYCRRFLRQLTTMRTYLKRLSLLTEEDASIKLSSDTKARIAKAIDALVENK